MTKIMVHDLEGHQYEIEANNYETDHGSGWEGLSGINFTAHATFSVSEAVQIARAILPGAYDIVKTGEDDEGTPCLVRYSRYDGQPDTDPEWVPLEDVK